MSKLQILNPSQKYRLVTEQITRSGHKTPAFDEGDKRYRQMWDYIVDNDLEIAMKSDVDYINDLASSSSPYISYFQIRVDTENDDIIEDYFQQFYVKNISMQRLPIGTFIEDELYLSAGNHRAKAHQRGSEIFPDMEVSRPVLVFDPDNKLTILEKKRHGLNIAAISNRRNSDQTAEETAGDIAKQLQKIIEVEEEFSGSSMSLEDAEKYCSDWLDKEKNLTERRKSIVLNKVFSDKISHPMEIPSQEDLNDMWKSFFGEEYFWNPDDSKTVQKIYPTHQNNFKSLMLNRWMARSSWSPVNERIEAVVRVGQSLNANITSEDTIQQGRKTFIESIEKWNTNVNILEGGMPILTKIMFAKQTENGNYRAFVWNEQTEKFVEKLDKN